MTEKIIITEGQTDEQILKGIFKIEGNPGLKFVHGSGRNSAASIARSFLIKGNTRTKVLIVLDTDTRNEEEIKNIKSYFNEYFEPYSSKERVKVVFFIPNITTEVLESVIKKDTKDAIISIESPLDMRIKIQDLEINNDAIKSKIDDISRVVEIKKNKNLNEIQKFIGKLS